ncbi:hypothetical protein BNJ_00419 [Kaumoebavirus]|uniref:hypothetical protein n=1 Tax=Kaumoebavirus TaxID=1859492 RepID=UPI0009C1D35B|nr:hypothetical protein BNJ_00419 [Kaumoebavirus]ARA72234.1 hypothetical protein BNJ_00419 [Kaumoebavirus]
MSKAALINFLAGSICTGFVGGIFYVENNIRKTESDNAAYSYKRYYKEECDSHRASRDRFSKEVEELRKKNKEFALKIMEHNGFTPVAKLKITRDLSKEIAKDIAPMVNPNATSRNEYKLRENISAQIEEKVVDIVEDILVKDPYKKEVTKSFEVCDSCYDDLSRVYGGYIDINAAKKYGFFPKKKITITPSSVKLN